MSERWQAGRAGGEGRRGQRSSGSARRVPVPRWCFLTVMDRRPLIVVAFLAGERCARDAAAIGLGR